MQQLWALLAIPKITFKITNSLLLTTNTQKYWSNPLRNLGLTVGKPLLNSELLQLDYYGGKQTNKQKTLPKSPNMLIYRLFVWFNGLQSNTIWMTFNCTTSLSNLLPGFTVLMLMRFLLLSSLNTPCSSYACLSHPQPCTTVKSLLNTVPADTREAALGSPGVSSSPDLFSPDPSASPESQCSSPWWSPWPFTELTPFCLCLSCIWRTKARYRCADNHFILTADGHINCHIVIPFPDYIFLILNIKKILALSV